VTEEGIENVLKIPNRMTISQEMLTKLGPRDVRELGLPLDRSVRAMT
jgi:hypothetical protein